MGASELVHCRLLVMSMAATVPGANGTFHVRKVLP